jgi:crotonyl-CoA carboxylase/reductase
MAAGVNYNNVWAGLGIPIDVIKARNKAGEPEEFHIGGSDASGIVYKAGKDVTNVKVGDEVVIHCGKWDRFCPSVMAGIDPMYSPTFRIWGYETNFGSFAQFTKVQGHMCLPKPKHLTWEGAAAYMLVGATAYRMLCGWSPNNVKPDDVALIWGGAGGLGSMAIQICRAFGAIPIAIIAGEDKVEYCESLGAKGCIDRRNFDHWGMLPHWKDNVGFSKWMKGVRKFGAAIWEILGEKRAPNIVFEHPGESTIPTSVFACDTGGMVVVCAGTTGYNATVDLRYLWMRQKRLQGSHFANDEQSEGFNNLVLQGLVDPCMSRCFVWDELPDSHQLMYENKHPHGNMSILVGATEFGQGVSAADPHLADHEAIAMGDTHEALDRFRLTPSARNISGEYASQHLDGVEPTVVDDGTLVKELMHKGVIACAPGDSLESVAKIMTDNDIHAVMVMEDNRAVGMVSQTDMVLARQGRTAQDARKMTARAVMTPGCASCDVGDTVAEAVSNMTGHRIHRLVVTENDVPVGVISMTDVVRKILVD